MATHHLFPLIFVALLWMGEQGNSAGVSRAEESSTFWTEMGQLLLLDALRIQPNMNEAKNVIIFIGDGMGVSTVMASRVYKGQQEGRPGEDSEISFEKFPHVSLVKTYSVSHQVPDSAATATALFSGVKTNTATLGVSARARVGDCESVFGNEIHSILKWAQDAGKDSGFVTTTRITHATPAALYAHTSQRDWESDSGMPPNASRCKDIARQLVEDLPGRDLKVILGGGRKHLTPNTVLDPKNKHNGTRKDGNNLIDYWIKEKDNRNARYKYVTNTEELRNVNVGNVDYLLGLFNYDHMQFELDRDNGPEGEPSLSSMTHTAISLLQKNQKGFFLMVEGGRIDHAHHSTNAKRALSDTLALADAVETTMRMVSEEDTLVIVTADHSHVFTVNGYPKRGSPILGIADISDKDGLPYTTLMYSNGPGYSLQDGGRRNLTDIDTEANNYVQDTAVPLKDETHGGEDVALYAIGPMAHLLHGVIEQNYVAHVMGYASCIGRNKNHCQRIGQKLPHSAPSTATRGLCSYHLIILLLIHSFVLIRLWN